MTNFKEALSKVILFLLHLTFKTEIAPLYRHIFYFNVGTLFAIGNALFLLLVLYCINKRLIVLSWPKRFNL